MNLKRVLISAALIAVVASSAYAQLGLNVGTLNLGPVGAPTSAVNLSNASAIIQSAPNAAGVYSYVMSANDGGAWDGMGITSSVAQAHPDLYSLAPVGVSEYNGNTGNTTFFGVTVSPTYDANGSIVLFTYGGDSNLDGIVNADDYGPIDSAVYNSNHGLSNPPATWMNGDVNLDGLVNADDYGSIDTAVYDANHGIAYLPSDHNLYPSGIAGAGGIKPVPEPSTLILGFLAVSCFLGFRKLWN